MNEHSVVRHQPVKNGFLCCSFSNILQLKNDHTIHDDEQYYYLLLEQLKTVFQELTTVILLMKNLDRVK